MIEIKFRAWDLDNNWMDDHFFIQSNGIAHGTPSKTFDTPNIEIEESPSLIIMQFTGLKDINGVDIYEGDIVYLAGYGDYIAEFPFIDLYDAAAENDIGNIKGNIHQNPELLN